MLQFTAILPKYYKVLVVFNTYPFKMSCVPNVSCTQSVLPLLSCMFGFGTAALRWLPWWPLIDWWQPAAASLYFSNATLWLLSPPVFPQSARIGGCRVTLVAFVRLFSTLSDWRQPAATFQWPDCAVWLGGQKVLSKADSKQGTSWCQYLAHPDLLPSTPPLPFFLSTPKNWKK